MRIPRFSIADVMALTVLAAADCLVLREAEGSSGDIRLALFFLGGLPLLNILVAGLAILWKRRRSDKPIAFWVGFETVGGVVLLGFSGIIAVFTDECGDLMNRASARLDFLAETFFPVGLVIGLATVMAIATLPQLVAAVLGGLFHRRYRLVIERRRPEVIPSV